MIANKLDIEELKKVGGGWVYRLDDNGVYVLDDKTVEIVDGPFQTVGEAERRAKELGLNFHGLTPALYEHFLEKNKNQ